MPGARPKRPCCCLPRGERLEDIIPSSGDGGPDVLSPSPITPDGTRSTVEFGVEIGEYRGVVRAPQRVFRRLLPERPTPERCVEAYYLQRTRFERIAERKLCRRQLTERMGMSKSAGATCAKRQVEIAPRSVSNFDRFRTRGPALFNGELVHTKVRFRVNVRLARNWPC
jgi:hypothetical protein